jgi:transmembrane sensor
MSGQSRDDVDARARVEAADWFARMRGPDAAPLASELAAWRAERPENDAAYEQIGRRWDQSAFLTNSALGRSRDLGRASVWSRRPLTRYAAAAVLALVVGAGAITIDRVGFAPRAKAEARYVSTDREIRTFALPDGSHVTLDAGSAIKVLSAQGRRGVQLVSGRARFDVATSTDTPFTVEADHGSMVSGAGLFDVSLLGGAVNVVLWRGSLNVSGDPVGAGGSTRSSRLMAGQQVRFLPLHPLPAPTAVSRRDMGWTRGMLSFDGVSLAEAVATINRYNRLQIVVAPRTANLRISGAFHATDPQGFARAVRTMFNLSLTKALDGSILLGPEIKA